MEWTYELLYGDAQDTPARGVKPGRREFSHGEGLAEGWASWEGYCFRDEIQFHISREVANISHSGLGLIQVAQFP